MNLSIQRQDIKDIERTQRYERLFESILPQDAFKKDILVNIGLSVMFVARALKQLESEGAIEADDNNEYHWNNEYRERYCEEWLEKSVGTHQIKRKAVEERPREKFLRYGAEKMDKTELLAIFLRTGIEGKNAIALAQELLDRFGGIRGIFDASEEDLKKIKGIGIAKIAQIKAVAALAKLYLEEKVKEKPLLENSQDVYDYLYHTMRDLKYELFKVIFLNGQNEIIEIEDAFKGTLTESSVHPREIAKLALDYNAAAMVFVHNHPSGDPTPSADDKKVTQRLVHLSEQIQIPVRDHIIIGDQRYYSFAEEGLIKKFRSDSEYIMRNL